MEEETTVNINKEEFLKVIRFALGMRLRDEYTVAILMDDIEQLLVTYEDEIERW